MGADVLINCKEVNLQQEVMRLTNGDGVPRLVEASGASPLVNTCFKMLQKVQIQNYCKEKLHFLSKIVQTHCEKPEGENRTSYNRGMS
jgi:hypothetical protein